MEEMMKKSLFLAATLFASVLSSSSASALDSRVVRTIRSSNLPFQSLLGVVQFTALGSQGRHCLYLMDWLSPFNPNDATVCILRELKSPVFPSCALNSVRDITSFVDAGPGAGTFCAGFDTLGIAYPDVTILAGEFQVEPVLQGTAIYPTPVPLIHAILVA
jgi:hypothetical protein